MDEVIISDGCGGMNTNHEDCPGQYDCKNKLCKECDADAGEAMLQEHERFLDTIR
jgi:hypothetical protein